MTKSAPMNIAAERFTLISPLLGEGLDQAEISKLRKEVQLKSGLSDRTLRRYVKAYQERGLEGLVPSTPKGSGFRSIPEQVFQEAVLLRREVPQRSVRTIIEILEREGRVQVGELKRSTLQDYFAKQGFSRRHLTMYQQQGAAARRFQQRYRNDLWQSDIKYGPHLPIGENGKLKPTYLVVILDDATRYIVHAAFYETFDQRIVEASLRDAMHQYGTPKAVYFDNGKQFRNDWMGRMCGKLGIRLLYTKAYSPESKGKVERFNRTIDSFIREIQLDLPKSIIRLN